MLESQDICCVFTHDWYYIQFQKCVLACCPPMPTSCIKVELHEQKYSGANLSFLGYTGCFLKIFYG